MKFKKPKTKIIPYASMIDIAPRFLTPARSFVPQWYKDEQRIPSETKGFKDKSIKHCIPFLDAFTLGYCITLPFDLFVEQRPDGPYISWGDEKYPGITVRQANMAPTMPVPAGYSPIEFVWCAAGCFKPPKGYSALLTHPLNHLELPFFSLSGVVDDFTVPHGNFPFFLKEDFEGTILKGTPILQVIPFKREDWLSVEQPELNIESELNGRRSLTTLYGWYRKTHWKRKNYN